MAAPTPLVYPRELPCPVSAPEQSSERRALSEIPGVRDSKAKWRERHGFRPLEFFLTFEQVTVWINWVENTLIQGGAWFAAEHWRSAIGGVGVYRFTEPPSYPVFRPKVGWHIQANVEFIARVPPQFYPVHPCFDLTYLDGIDAWDSISGDFGIFSIVGSPYGQAMHIDSQSAIVDAEISHSMIVTAAVTISFPFKVYDTNTPAGWIEIWNDDVLITFKPSVDLGGSVRPRLTIVAETKSVATAVLTVGAWYRIEIKIVPLAGNTTVRITNLSDATFFDTTFAGDFSAMDVTSIHFFSPSVEGFTGESIFGPIHICQE